MIYNVLFITILVNLFIFFKFSYLSKKINCFDYPNIKRKIHKKKIPLLGGTFIFINFLILILFYIFFFDNSVFYLNIFGYEENFKNTKSMRTFFSFFIFPIIFFLLGFFDDKKNINSHNKIIYFAILIFSALLIDSSLIIKELNFDFLSKKIELYNFALFFTVFSILALLNAVNMFDGINMQCGIFYLFAFSHLLLINNFNFFIIFILIQIFIFLFYNFSGKIFLGNSGNLFLTFLLSIFYIKFYNLNYIKNIELILFTFIIPGLDLIRLFFKRMWNGYHPFSADLNHIHHILISKYSLIKVNLILLLLQLFPLASYYLINNFYFSLIIAIISYLTVLKIKTK